MKNIKLNIIKILSAIIIFSVINSCSKTMDYEDTNFQKMLVVNGIIYQDSIVKINVSRNKSIMESDSVLPFMENATVKLFENETYVENLIYDSIGYYHSNLITKANTSYKIEVEADGYDKAVATFDFEDIQDFSVSNVIKQVKDSTCYISMPEEMVLQIKHNIIELDLSFTDNSAQNNYYYWSAETETPIFIYNSCFDEFCDSLVPYLYEDRFNRNISLSFKNEVDYFKFRDSYSFCYNHNCFSIITDNLFIGEKMTFQLQADYLCTKAEPFKLTFFSYPESFIKFVEASNLYSDAQNNPFSQPVNLYSNVENGIGFVCGITCRKFVIEIN